MATKKFIKLYSILSDDIDNEGNINPNAALYPLFASQYIDNRTGKCYSDLSPEQVPERLSDEDTPYDNSSNAHSDRTVGIMEKHSDPSEDEDYSDIIDINDILSNGYDPTRDFPSEQQIKRIIKRSVIPKEYLNVRRINKIELMKNITDYGKDYAVYILNILRRLKNSDLQNALSLLDNLALACKNYYSFIHDGGDVYRKDFPLVAKEFNRLAGKVPNFITILTKLSLFIGNLGHDANVLKHSLRHGTGDIDKQLQSIRQMIPTVESELRDSIQQFNQILSILNNMPYSDDSIHTDTSYDFSKILGKGGAFDWYDDTTSSDERIKNIIDTGRQVTLSDRQQKYILDDFNKFCDGYQRHNNLLNGIKEIGQW